MHQFAARALLALAPVALALLTAIPAARAEQPVTTFTLDNGMTVVVIEDHRAPVVTHMVWYPVGAADEPPGQSGVAHFFEHLMFGGTDDLAPGEFNLTVAANGGAGNAFTSYDYTGYYQRIAADRLGLMMELEAERMRDLILDDKAVDTERAVILEERSQRTDNNPQSLFGEQIRAAQYQNHPYGIPVIGWRHEIEQLTTEDARAFYDRYYTPDNAILVVAGDVTPEEVRSLAEEHYGPLEPSGVAPDPRPQEPPQRAPRRLEMTDPGVRQPYLMRTYLTPNFDPENPGEAAALEVAAEVLGGGITSMLSKELQVERGLSIGTGAWYDGWGRDDSSFGVYAASAPGVELAEVEAGVDEVLERLKTEGPDPEQLERVKSRLLANEIYAQDDQTALARRYGAALASGFSVADVQGWPDAVEAVTAEDVQRVVQTHVTPEVSVSGWLMPAPGAPEAAPEAEPTAPAIAPVEEAG